MVTPRPRYGTLPCVVGSLLLALFAGCGTVGPDHEAPTVEAPTRWADRHGGDAVLAAPGDAAAALPADRWAVFGDAALARLQARALQANDDVRTAALHLLQSRVEESTVSAQRGVQVTARAGMARQRQSEDGAASRLVNAIGGPGTPQLLKVLSAPFSLYQAGFDASWEPDLWGRVLRSEEAARAGTEAQRATLRQVQLGVAAEVARVYFSLRAAQRQRLLAEDEVQAAQELEGLLAAQQRQGLADASALIRQQAQLAGLRSLLPQVQAQEAQALNRLTLLCGTDPGALNEELAAARMAQPVVALPDLRLGLPADLARRRPDIAAAEARLHAATATIGVAMADLYPRVTLGASFGLESVGSTQFADWRSRQWSVGPSLALPLWDQGRRRATITLRELQQQEAAVAWQQAVLKAWHEVDDAIAGYIAETRREQEMAERTGSAEDEARLARARYAQGLTSYLPVLAATTALIEAQRDEVDGAARVRTALAALFKALGDDGPERSPGG
jgi:NodT family efflux transporter outer membrane factor (OMF) lipoprotein